MLDADFHRLVWESLFFSRAFPVLPATLPHPLALKSPFVGLCEFYYCGRRFIFCHSSDLIKVCVGRQIIRAEKGVMITKFAFSESLEAGHASRRCNLFSFPTKKLLKSQNKKKSNLFHFYCLHLGCVFLCEFVCVSLQM